MSVVALKGAPWADTRIRMLDRYLALLAEAGSPLLLGGEAVMSQVKRQFLAVVDDVTSEDNPPVTSGSALSTSIGRARASAGIHPSESLAAANLIFAAALPDLVARREQTVGATFGDTALRLNAAILKRMAEAASGYVNYLLDKAATAHRDEARRLSRELHDAVAPAVAVGLQRIELTEHYLSEDPERAGEKVRSARDALLEAITLIRSLTAETRVAIVPGDLPAALRRHLSTLPPATRTGLHFEGDVTRLPAHYAYEVFLILREAIRNAAKHGQPSEVLVDLQLTAAQFVGIVTDDGGGFDTRARAETGTGLSSMRERAALLGGGLAIASEPSQTRVTLTVPLPHGETR